MRNVDTCNNVDACNNAGTCHAEKCTLCPRSCGVDRAAASGFCRMPNRPVAARAALHYGEEPCLGGEDGAGAIFFSGCNLQCVFCQNFELSRGRVGKELTVFQLAGLFEKLEEQGAKCIDLVNPTHFQEPIRQALMLHRPSVPVVWNSSGYERAGEIAKMEGLVDVYLPDLKFVSPAVSQRLAGAADYFAVASKALREMVRQTGKAVVDDSGLMRRGMIVRHLVLPGHLEETRKALVWIRRALPEAYLSLMAQYTPYGDAVKYPPLNRPLSQEEYDTAVSYAEELGFENGFLQELSASTTAEIPLFDLTGL